MTSMNISVPDQMRQWVETRIQSGRYASVSDYVRDLIRRDQEADWARPLSIEDIRASIGEGRALGETHDADSVFQRLRTKIETQAKS